MHDEQIQDLIRKMLDDKYEWARLNSPETFRWLSSLNFRDKRYIAEAVYESIRGFGVLGQIISDPDVTEVMINGYKDIFIEKAGKLFKVDD